MTTVPPALRENHRLEHVLGLVEAVGIVPRVTTTEVPEADDPHLLNGVLERTEASRMTFVPRIAAISPIMALVMRLVQIRTGVRADKVSSLMRTGVRVVVVVDDVVARMDWMVRLGLTDPDEVTVQLAMRDQDEAIPHAFRMVLAPKEIVDVETIVAGAEVAAGVMTTIAGDATKADRREVVATRVEAEIMEFRAEAGRFRRLVK